MTLPAPFKVCIPSRGKARIGVAACSYEHLREVLRKKYDVGGDFCLQQDDGTLVCDEDYFKLLEPNTLLTVVESENTAAIMGQLTSGQGISCGNKRPALPGSALAVQQKRPHIAEAPQTHSFHPTPPQSTNFIVPAHVTRPAQPLHHFSPSRVSRCPPSLPVSSPIPGIIPLPRTDAVYVASGSRQPSSGGGASLASQLQITDVMGNVSMSSSPPRQVQRVPPPPALLNPLSHQPMSRLTPMNVMYRVPRSHLPAPHTHHPQTLPAQFHCAPAPTYQYVRVPRYPPSNIPLYPSSSNPPPYLPVPCHPSHTPGVPLNPFPRVPHFPTTSVSPTHNFPSLPAAPNPPLTASLPSSPKPPHLPTSSPTPCPSAVSLSPNPPVPHAPKTPPATSLPPSPNPPHAPVPLAPKPPETSLPPSPNPSPHTPVPSATSLPPVPNPPPQSPSSSNQQQQNYQRIAPGSVTPPPPPVSNTTSTVEPSSLPSPIFTLNLPPSPTDIEPMKLSTLQVVSCPNDATSLADSDEDEDKLCIIEQGCPPTDNTPHHQKPLAKRRQKPSVLPIATLSTQSLGDAKYPIIIDGEDDTATEVVDFNFPDEGYSSSSSPYDTLCDFTSALPFASYEAENKTSRGRSDALTNKDEEVETETLVEDPNTQIECVSDDADEEDFDMDVDVFSPLPPQALPTKTRPCQWQPPLPDYLPLELDSQREEPPFDKDQLAGASYSSEGSSDEGNLVVSIPRQSLTDPLYRKRRCPSLTDNLYVPPSHTSPRPRRREYIRRLSRLSVSSDLKKHVRHKHKRRKQKRRRYSAPVSSCCFPSCTRPEHLMVHIPIHRGKDGDIMCGECSDDDVPTTAMELLAARLDETKGPRRLPQIIRLESFVPREELDCKTVAESEIEVADYCSEVNVMSVCSAEDLTKCVKDLASQCCHMNLWNGSEGSGGTPLDIGEEIELSGPSQNCTEMTGMELLNLQRSSPPSTNTKTLHSQSLELPEATWSVHSLDNRGCLSDPRQRIQKYYLGNKVLFVLSCSNGRWWLNKP